MGVPFRLLGKHPQTPVMISAKSAAHLRCFLLLDLMLRYVNFALIEMLNLGIMQTKGWGLLYENRW